jgi:hypothetical protein
VRGIIRPLMAKRVRRKTRSAVPPTCNCLLLCDEVLIGQAKPKHYLQGIIGLIGVKEVPAVIGRFVAYVRISNVHGEQKISLVFEPAKGGDSLFTVEVGLPSQADPLGVYTLVIPVPPFVVPEAGRYMFSAYHAGIPITQSPIEIRTATSDAQEGTRDDD